MLDRLAALEAEAPPLHETRRFIELSPQVRVERLYISAGHNYFEHHGKPAGDHRTIECPEIWCAADRGVRGDRFYDHKDNYKGQITFFASEVFEAVCRHSGVAGKSPGVLRRNVITAGVDLNSLIGMEFSLQGVRFAGVEECRPCHWMDQALAPGAEAALRGRGGLRALILTDGPLRTAI